MNAVFKLTRRTAYRVDQWVDTSCSSRFVKDIFAVDHGLHRQGQVRYGQVISAVSVLLLNIWLRQPTIGGVAMGVRPLGSLTKSDRSLRRYATGS